MVSPQLPMVNQQQQQVRAIVDNSEITRHLQAISEKQIQEMRSIANGLDASIRRRLEEQSQRQNELDDLKKAFKRQEKQLNQ